MTTTKSEEKFIKKAAHLKPRVIYQVCGIFLKSGDGISLEYFWTLKQAQEFKKLMLANLEYRKAYKDFTIDDVYVVQLGGMLHWFGFDTEAEAPLREIRSSAKGIFSKKHAKFDFEAHKKGLLEMVYGRGKIPDHAK